MVIRSAGSPRGLAHSFSRPSLRVTRLGKRSKVQCAAQQKSLERPSGFFPAGPEEPPPSYEDVDRQPLNKAMMGLFRSRLKGHLNTDSQLPGYDGVMELTKDLSQRYATPQQVQQNTVQILSSLFPSWLPPAFKAVLSANIPGPACKLNAWVTAFTCQWLMGPSQVTDVETDDGNLLKSQGVKIERRGTACWPTVWLEIVPSFGRGLVDSQRVKAASDKQAGATVNSKQGAGFLESSACASVCINCCKIPTQEFFRTEMGLPLRMTPNYEDYSCQFDFGVAPLPPEEDEAFHIPCFEQCPSKHRRKHQCKSVVAPT
ncbi:hypothetical protein WJX84_010435 [Apatococcus fuscideae]|uniref:Beta-carotene isomerase D27-like C-terminal domain-containing protein n=1 Tax=Apatococcus fuscideae TaxID=2026836 RepID=A0AAW1T601_9CHLO